MKQKSKTPMVQNSSSSMKIPLSQTIKEGFGFGIGSSLAHNAVNGVINFLTPPKSSNPVDNKKLMEYEKCMKYSVDDHDTCKSLLTS